METYLTTRKLKNTNGNTDVMFPSLNYNEFYGQKYSLGKYQGNYNEKKRIKAELKSIITCY